MTSPRFFDAKEDGVAYRADSEYQRVIRVSSFEDLLLVNLEKLQVLFKRLSALEHESTIDQHTPDMRKLYLEYINGALIDLILTYHSNDTNFDILTFLKDYIAAINLHASRDNATPARVKMQMQHWINTLPQERSTPNNG